MEPILRGLTVYVFILLVFRLTGKRTFSDVTPFDFVLLLIISECAQQGLTGDDHSVVGSMILILTLVMADVAMSLLKRRSKRMEHWLEGLPLVLIENGQPHRERMWMERVDPDDILQAARTQHGMERMDQIKHAVLERSGEITIIPKEGNGNRQ